MRNYRNKDVGDKIIRLRVIAGILALLAVQAILGRMDAEADLEITQTRLTEYEQSRHYHQRVPSPQPSPVGRGGSHQLWEGEL